MCFLACIALCASFFASSDSLEQRFSASVEAVFDKGQLREMHVYPIGRLRIDGYGRYSVVPVDTFFIVALNQQWQSDSLAKMLDKSCEYGSVYLSMGEKLSYSDVCFRLFSLMAETSWNFNQLDVLFLEDDSLDDYISCGLSNSRAILRDRRTGCCRRLSENRVFSSMEHLIRYIALGKENCSTRNLPKPFLDAVVTMFCHGTVRAVQTYPISVISFNRDGGYSLSTDSVQLVAAIGSSHNSIYVGDARFGETVGRVGLYDGKEVYMGDFAHKFFYMMASKNWDYNDLEMLRLKEENLIDKDYGKAFGCIIMRYIKTGQCVDVFHEKTYSNILHYMQVNHGGVTAYLDRIDFERRTTEYVEQNNPKTYQKLLEYMDSSLFFYTLRYMGAEDTVKIVNWYVKDISKMVDLDDSTKQYLFDGIRKKLSPSREDVSSSCIFDLLRIDVSEVVRSALSAEQYKIATEKMIFLKELDKRVFGDAVANFYQLQEQGIIPKEYEWKEWVNRFIYNFRYEIKGEKVPATESLKGILIR